MYIKYLMSLLIQCLVVLNDHLCKPITESVMSFLIAFRNPMKVCYSAANALLILIRLSQQKTVLFKSILMMLVGWRTATHSRYSLLRMLSSPDPLLAVQAMLLKERNAVMRQTSWHPSLTRLREQRMSKMFSIRNNVTVYTP